MPWSVQSWLAGTTAEDGSAAGSIPSAHDLASLIAALRRVDPSGRSFDRGWRGGELSAHRRWVRKSLDKSKALLDVARLGGLGATLRSVAAHLARRDVSR